MIHIKAVEEQCSYLFLIDYVDDCYPNTGCKSLASSELRQKT